MKDNGWIIHIRVPHCSHLTQGEDMINFSVLKREIRREIAAAVEERAKQGNFKALGESDGFPLLHLPVVPL